MPRKISPPLSELANLRTPLTEGEQKVFELFDSKLPEAWEIYLQPHMNGLRPDFVLLNPNVGIAVFEVKDWVLDGSIEYFVENQRTGPVLKARDKRTGEIWRAKENPVQKTHAYRSEIFELYCPRLSSTARRKGVAVVSGGVIFTEAPESEVSKLFRVFMPGTNASPYFTLTGRESVEQGDLETIFPTSKRVRSAYMQPRLAEDLRCWLEEPEVSAEQRRPFRLTSRQNQLATERTESGYRRIMGPAGSGKSFVLAARAVHLAAQGKDVTVLCFNLTLVNFLRDLAARYAHQLGQSHLTNQITFVSFHLWCKRVCIELNALDRYQEMWKDHFPENASNSQPGEGEIPEEVLNSVLESDMPNLVSEVLGERLAGEHYNLDEVTSDAILVDEGQDFLPNWWQLLRQTLKDGGEMVLARDTTQDIYEKSGRWVADEMTRCGFRGDWARLDSNFRLPRILTDLIRDFCSHFLSGSDIDMPVYSDQSSFLDQIEGPCDLAWLQCNSTDFTQSLLSTVLGMPGMATEGVLPYADMTVLVPNHKVGRTLVRALNEFNISTQDTFGPNWNARAKKMSFFKGAPKVKVTTFHSFKGIESRALVIAMPATRTVQPKTLYTALTRLRRSEDRGISSILRVVSANPKYESFGRTWPTFETTVAMTPRSASSTFFASNPLSKTAPSSTATTMVTAAG